jgi:hypothetical protein
MHMYNILSIGKASVFVMPWVFFCWALPPQGQGLLHWIQLLEVLPY